MSFVKIQKNNTYFKRFQVKFRRRREGKTDYYQRKRLVTQRKNKYNTPKWRFVVRRTNRRVICQVVWSTLAGDRVKASADSFELRRYGVTAGLTNYAAAYSTGLLCARRLLTTLDEENKKRNINTSMASTFNLVPETTGEYVDIAALAEKKGVETRPFTCFLDLGLARATRGNRVFAAMKGAVDGGIHIPHSDKIFPQVKDAKKDKSNPLRDRIFGVHVQNYMDLLKKGGDYKLQFSEWDKCLSAAKVNKLEDLYKKVHQEVRKNPKRVAAAKKEYKVERDAKDPHVTIVNGVRVKRNRRLDNATRKKRVQEKIARYLKDRKK